jgi:hypothetical protein
MLLNGLSCSHQGETEIICSAETAQGCEIGTETGDDDVDVGFGVSWGIKCHHAAEA